MNNTEHIRSALEQDRITRLQLTVVLICFVMNMLDGMDVVVIAYAAPVLAENWSITPEKLGVIFGSGLVGMAAGSLLLAPLADRVGRRNIMMVSLIFMGVGTLLSGFAQSENQLIVLRFLCGLGIGAMLPTSSTMSAEYAPSRMQNILICLVLSGYPIGAMLTGVVSAWIIPEFGWRAIFIVSGMGTLLILPFVYALLPESLVFLVNCRPVGALAKVNRTLRRMGCPEIDELPSVPTRARAENTPVAELFAEGRKMKTIALWIAYFLSFASIYFLHSWIPRLATGAGYSIEFAIYAGTIFNLGATLGIVSFGYLSQLFNLERMIVLFLLASAGIMLTFGYVLDTWITLFLFALLGFFIQGGFSGFYIFCAQFYPTEIRNTGIGWAIGVGRSGAIIGPVIAGTLVGMGFGMAATVAFFSVPLVVAASVISLIKAEPGSS
jgi:AAHS family 4-hydroxybenzoate transporter-like MFS transporter